MNGELLALLEYYERERGIDKNSLFEALESALLQAGKKAVGPSRDLRIEIDRKTGMLRAFAKLQVVESVSNPHEQIALSRARLYKPDAQIGDDVEMEVTPKNFGRIAAQTAKQAIMGKIRSVEKEKIFTEYKDRIGDIVSGIVRRFDKSDVIIDLGHCEALLPHRERVPTEEYQVGDRIRCYISSIETTVQGPEIILSRASADFIRRLFELEVSEIADGTVEIKTIAREPGYRTKIAVASKDEKVDPVGACVGMRGTRVKNIVRELSNERMDIVPWRPNPRDFVIEALKPAKLRSVEIDEAAQTARVTCDEDQLSLAIGKRGQNVRLAMKLTGYRIDVSRDETAAITFEQKVSQAITEMASIPGLNPDLARQLVHAGFHSLDDLLAADIEDLALIEGVGAEVARNVLEAARAEKERRAPMAVVGSSNLEHATLPPSPTPATETASSPPAASDPSPASSPNPSTPEEGR